MARYIGIDLGTANTLVYLKGKGIVLKEPSVVAIETSTGRVLAVGQKAKDMIGRTPGEVVVERPLKNGVIADFDVTRAMLKEFIEKASPGGVLRPYVTICIPYGVTEVEKRAVLEAVIHSGGKNAYLIEEPMAAAMGAQLPVSDATGSMIIDIGGGTTEVAVVSFGGIVSATSIRYAGDKMDADIASYIKNAYNLIIGEKCAEDIKINIATAHPSSKEKSMGVMGRDLATGLPKMITLTSSEIRCAILDTIDKIIGAIKSTLENTPPELAADVVERGIVLTGGGARLSGLDVLIKEKIGIKTIISEDAEECVVKGAGMAISSASGASKGGRMAKKTIFQRA